MEGGLKCQSYSSVFWLSVSHITVISEMTVKFDVQNSSPRLLLLTCATPPCPPEPSRAPRTGASVPGKWGKGPGCCRVLNGPPRLPLPHTRTPRTLCHLLLQTTATVLLGAGKVREFVPTPQRWRLCEACDYRITRGSLSERQLAPASGSLATARGRLVHLLLWPGSLQRRGLPQQLHPNGDL